jgi:hypothetical protein
MEESGVANHAGNVGAEELYEGAAFGRGSMSNGTSSVHSEECILKLRNELRRLNLHQIETRYVPERDVIRLSWPHATRAADFEEVEFPATPEWTTRIGHFLGTYARSRKRSILYSVA